MKRRIIIICAGLLMALPIVAQEFRPGSFGWIESQCAK